MRLNDKARLPFRSKRGDATFLLTLIFFVFSSLLLAPLALSCRDCISASCQLHNVLSTLALGNNCSAFRYFVSFLTQAKFMGRKCTVRIDAPKYRMTMMPTIMSSSALSPITATIYLFMHTIIVLLGYIVAGLCSSTSTSVAFDYLWSTSQQGRSLSMRCYKCQQNRIQKLQNTHIRTN